MPEIAKLQEQVHTLFENDNRHERDMDSLRRDVQECNRELLNEIKNLRDEIKNLYNRLPTWATIALAILCAIMGGLVGKEGGF